MSPKFSRKSIDSKTLGERLREIRERAGASIEEIASAIKVNKKYLRQIEADDYENMPSEIYIRGFLKNYSNFLGIEARDVIKIYEKERGIAHNIKKREEVKEKKPKIRVPTVILSSKIISSALFGLFVLLIGWYFYREAGQFSETPRLLISKPINNSIIHQSSTELVGVTDIGNRVTINERVIFVSEKGEFREQISLKDGINELAVRAVNKFGKEITRTIKLSAQYNKQLPDKNTKNKEDNGQEGEEKTDRVRLVVRAKDAPVWIAVKVDGVDVYNGTILAGAEQIFEGNNEVSITSGRANQTLIKVDDEQDFHELATEAGVIRDVIFKKQEQDNIKVQEEGDKLNNENEKSLP